MLTTTYSDIELPHCLSDCLSASDTCVRTRGTKARMRKQRLRLEGTAREQTTERDIDTWAWERDTEEKTENSQEAEQESTHCHSNLSICWDHHNTHWILCTLGFEHSDPCIAERAMGSTPQGEYSLQKKQTDKSTMFTLSNKLCV